MSIWELLLLAVGLSMDAFAASVCKGLSVQRIRIQYCLLTGLYFGVAQAVMPMLGYFLGVQFQNAIQQIDHWIAFVLLAFIGGNMIAESRKEGEEGNESFGWRVMLPLAIATSIDALAVGVTFAFLGVDFLSAALLIGLVTFTLSAVGVGLGRTFGQRYRSRAELLGGLVLVLIGVKILVEHLFFS